MLLQYGHEYPNNRKHYNKLVLTRAKQKKESKGLLLLHHFGSKGSID